MKLTAGPHSDENKGLSTGHAAHINAAAAKGPRYDVSQSPVQRKSISNGLWLCRECGDIVDKDDSKHTAELLRQWKHDHETMIAEVRTKGYAESIILLQSKRQEPVLAKRVIAILEDRRTLWQSFDAEFPDRVRKSLDLLRSGFVDFRYELPDGSPLDSILLALTKTILIFFNSVESSDLASLKCNSNDPEWRRFCEALAVLRKAIGLQINNLADAYDIKLSEDLQRIAPLKT